uniref:Thyroglobulin type-1 domain-containing protein n=1 Tax=Anisakis simplex TaxID=6269 RepID=A0A0M3IYI8_ANISI
LDEFGECSAQFEYNCSNYAKRFQSDEPIFCRTTRQKALNSRFCSRFWLDFEGFTQFNECISEQDHYRTFPKKDYRLQEECDLIESESQELAYCLCGTDLCNERPIAEQFIAFEEEHPELFSDSDNNESTSLKPTPSEMPNRAKTDEKSAFDADQSGLEQMEAAKGGQQQLRRHPAIHTHANDQVHKNIQSVPNAESGSVSELSASEGTHLLVDAGSSTTPSTLKCLQCAQGNLEDSRADCAQQIVVECDRRSSATRGSDQPEYFCLTRQILIARDLDLKAPLLKGQNAIEKMCVTHTALVEEYGNGVDHDGCTITNAGHVRYCVCQTDECNRLTINEQISMSNPPSLDYDSTSAPSMASTQKSIISPNSQRVVSCHVCSESRLSSPEADCSKPVVVNCNKQFEDGSGIYCLSKRTQLTPTMYSLEKRCLSQGELSNQSGADSISRDALTVGCHEAYDGLVVYCICQEVVALNPGISLQNMLGESDGDDRMTASSSVASVSC